jgi:hypothetical protein
MNLSKAYLGLTSVSNRLEVTAYVTIEIGKNGRKIWMLD